jgi:hypothetical protein
MRAARREPLVSGPSRGWLLRSASSFRGRGRPWPCSHARTRALVPASAPPVPLTAARDSSAVMPWRGVDGIPCPLPARGPCPVTPSSDSTASANGEGANTAAEAGSEGRSSRGTGTGACTGRRRGRVLEEGVAGKCAREPASAAAVGTGPGGGAGAGAGAREGDRMLSSAGCRGGLVTEGLEGSRALAGTLGPRPVAAPLTKLPSTARTPSLTATVGVAGARPAPVSPPPKKVFSAARTPSLPAMAGAGAGAGAGARAFTAATCAVPAPPYPLRISSRRPHASSTAPGVAS